MTVLVLSIGGPSYWHFRILAEASLGVTLGRFGELRIPLPESRKDSSLVREMSH
jgi:hypothetical protein